MFSKRFWFVAIIMVCVLALVAVALVQAQNGQQRPGNRPGGPPQGGPRVMDVPQCPVRMFGPPAPQMMQRLATELQLTDEQQKRATELVGALDAKIKEIVGDKNLMRDLIAELKSETTAPAKVKELGNQIARQEGAVLQAELETWLKYEQMLTPEQRAKFWTLFPRPMGLVAPRPGAPGGPGAPGAPGQPPEAPAVK